jgi:5'-phosphate synthase pdxT subunit
MAALNIGVLALQGAFAAHQEILRDIGCTTRQVREPKDLVGLHALVMPGGESTTMSKLLLTSGLFEPIGQAIDDGMAVFGTCAGMILLASAIEDGRADQCSFGVLGITVQRNAYGRQVDSFETDLDVVGLDEPFHAVFIRAPRVTRFGSVEVLARLDDEPVLVRQGKAWAASFHPELQADDRIHRLFVECVEKE